MYPAQKLPAQMSEGTWRPDCAICKKSVEIEESKTDEYGRAVHEGCYVSDHVQKKPSQPLRLAHGAVTRLGSWSKPLARVLMFRSRRERNET